MFPKSSRLTNYVLSAVLVGLVTLGSCKKDDPKSRLAGLTSFSIKDLNVPFTIDETQRIIQNADSLPFQTDVSAYIANFTAVPLSTVKVGGVVQTSGTTVNDFSDPLQYDVVAEDGVTTRSYTVRVNVALVDPNTVAWNQVTANGGWASYYSTAANYFNNKFWLTGKSLDTWDANTKAGYFSSTDGIAWNPLKIVDVKGDSIPYGLESTLINFNNKMWILGGHIGGWGSVSNSVWSTADGNSWDLSEAGVSKRWSGRQRIPAVVFKNKIWIIGGNGFPSYNNLNTSGTPYRDIWSSSNGTDWDSVIATPAFTPRTSPAVFVYNDKIWLVGGKQGEGTSAVYLNDVWNSTDGKNWTEVSTGTSFTPRWGHKVVVFNDEIFLLGGENETGVLGDFWVSSDGGLNWVKIEAGNPRALPANFTPRAFFSMFVADNNLWIIGGRGEKVNNAYTIKTDVWKGSLVK